MKIGENIKKMRLKQGDSQSQFAKKLEISRTYLSDLENNRKSPSIETVTKIAEKLGISTNELLYGEESKYKLYGNPKLDTIDVSRFTNAETLLSFIIKKNNKTVLDVPEIFSDEGKLLDNPQLYKLAQNFTDKNIKLISYKLSDDDILEQLSIHYQLCKLLGIKSDISLFDEDQEYFYLSLLRQDYYFMKNQESKLD
ncbi:helix-turn-helix domain-containing protein [Enterococcus asini]|uniref:helix-turn-helix domain-containing protein n=1 Tax=Enterococcus asini TaxID=57732 RepID=UPI001E2D8934|nr:helix-turn-helix transcriptional regulator [Enterococcus asini]MCD5030359.1 helix-turn-helix transcriptional regulator [Enterococcus asini]